MTSNGKRTDEESSCAFRAKTMQNAGVDLLNSVPLEEADMAKFRQVLDINIMSAVLVSGLFT